MITITTLIVTVRSAWVGKLCKAALGIDWMKWLASIINEVTG